MPIKFPQLLQDSWNFIRNQRQFSLTGWTLLFVIQLAVVYLSPAVAVSEQDLQSAEAMQQLLIQQFFPAMISALGSVFISILLILNIKSINQGNYSSFFQNLGQAMKALFPVIILTILMVMPLSIGVSFGGTVGQSGGLAIMMLPLMATGIYIFVKLSLVIYAYLIETPQKGIFETLKFTWGLSRGRFSVLFFFCLLSYLMPSVLSSLVASIAGDIGLLFAQMAGAFISLFVVVFSFRFYQVYRG